jgi:DNA polymerase
MKDILYFDLETYSAVDIKKAGAYRYSEECELMLCGFLLNDQYQSWEVGEQLPDWVVEHIVEGGICKAWNAQFDWLVFNQEPSIHYVIKLDQLQDIAAKACAHGLPPSLDKACKALRIPSDLAKYKEGKRLVQKFCKPRNVAESNPVKRFTKETSPKEWEEFKHVYLPNDCYAIREIDRMLPDLTDYEEQVWRETTDINSAGVPIDEKTADFIDKQIDEYIDEETTKCIRISGLWPTQRDKIMGWCQEQGCALPNLQKETVAEYIKAESTPDIVKDLLVTRANTANVSLKKYKSIKRTICQDGTVKGTLFYHAGITGRWGGRLLQVHNLPRGKIDSIKAIELLLDSQFSTEAAVSAIRGLIACPEGVTVYDWSQIEARIVQWLAGDMDALKIFTSGRDPYITFAAETVYGKDYDDITDAERFMAKQAILGLGFEMWATKFEIMLKQFNVENIPPMEELKRIVLAYRDKHGILKRFWGLMNKGALLAMERPGQTIRVNKKISFTKLNNFLYMTLPSGRNLAYCDPEIRENRFGHPGLTYMGLNDQSQWVRIDTYGGKLTENATQAVARDVLAEATSRCLSNGYQVLFHLHDEIILRGECPYVEALLVQRPEWAQDLPLAAEGEWSPRYRKI